MLVCQDRECGHRKTVAKQTNARCPVCHKRMELRGHGKLQPSPASAATAKSSPFSKSAEPNDKNSKASKRDVHCLHEKAKQR